MLFVHDQVAEEKFVADGWGVRRYPVMYNDFILVGPKADPAGAKGKYLQKVAVSSTMGPGVKVDVAEIAGV